MKKITIYEPALCCTTGVCDEREDPELLRIFTVLALLRKKGITINRYNITDSPQEFVKNTKVNELLNNEGVEVLPLVDVDGTIVITKRYPSLDEILQILDISREFLGMVKPGSMKSCCCRNKGCC